MNTIPFLPPRITGVDRRQATSLRSIAHRVASVRATTSGRLSTCAKRWRSIPASFQHTAVWESYGQKGEFDNALAELQKAKQLAGALTYTTLFGLLIATGMRVNEALGLDRLDVDLKPASFTSGGRSSGNRVMCPFILPLWRF
jgi:integrase